MTLSSPSITTLLYESALSSGLISKTAGTRSTSEPDQSVSDTTAKVIGYEATG